MSNPFNTPIFLAEHWQQTPLLVRNAFELSDLISADELAGLALEQEVESRLIQGHSTDEDWHIKHGPFTASDFENLPKDNWTLLVQAVDHWLPEVRDVLKSFSFLPQWRIDDIMISFATDGGGVGPHYDQYDVFLIQLSGQRQWKTGQLCDDSSDIVEQLPVKILSEFEEQDSWVLNPGDTLYLPPAVAHWGTSIGDSLTLSVGFRAPAESEFMSDFGHFLAASVSDFMRYQDANIENRAKNPHQILASDVERLQKILIKYSEEKSLLEQWLGQYMTEPKYADAGVDTGDWSFDDFLIHWQQDALFRNAASRMAYTNHTLYVDGQNIPTRLNNDQLHQICEQESFKFQPAYDDQTLDYQKVLWALLNTGALFFEQ